MKLRNKKTGEIIELLAKPSFVKRNDDFLQSEINTFNSLAELNAEWEDMPEESVKPYWFINDLDGEPMKCDLKNCGKSNFIEWSKHRKQIGNYFETKEEAEIAVAKLKAWKRLKDKGLRFYNNKTICEYGNVSYGLDYIVSGVDEKDLNLLFGVEE